MAVRRTFTGLGHLRTLLSSNASRSSKVLAGIALFYLVWPLDLLPDFIPIIGQVDDLLVVILLLGQAYRLLQGHQTAGSEPKPQNKRFQLPNVIDVG